MRHVGNIYFMLVWEIRCGQMVMSLYIPWKTLCYAFTTLESFLDIQILIKPTDVPLYIDSWMTIIRKSFFVAI